jgi:hypothetical protein
MTTNTNLRESRKAMAEQRKAAKAPAKKAPAQAPAKKPAATAASTKLRWSFPDGYDNRATTGQTASHDGGELSMKPGEKG